MPLTSLNTPFRATASDPGQVCQRNELQPQVWVKTNIYSLSAHLESYIGSLGRYFIDKNMNISISSKLLQRLAAVGQ